MDYRIGIIDDDNTKITQLLTYLTLGWEDENNKILKNQYKDVKLLPIEIPLENDFEKMVDKSCLAKMDALIIDFQLSSQENIAYSGVLLAQAIDKRLRGFPIFILTSYQDDLYAKECFDVYQVFDFERYINELEERLEINSKIVEQIKKYQATLDAWKNELLSLIPKAGTNVEVDNRILELDTLIENSINGRSALPYKLKQELNDTYRIQLLINKIDKLIDEEVKD